MSMGGDWLNYNNIHSQQEIRSGTRRPQLTASRSQRALKTSRGRKTARKASADKLLGIVTSSAIGRPAS